jgi:hypothetical protein
MDACKDQRKINVLEAMHYSVSAWWQVMQQTIENYFRKAGYRRGQPSHVSDVAMRNKDDDAFHHDWQKFSGMGNKKFDNCVSVDSRLVTSGVNMVGELCESHVGA